VINRNSGPVVATSIVPQKADLIKLARKQWN